LFFTFGQEHFLADHLIIPLLITTFHLWEARLLYIKALNVFSQVKYTNTSS